MKILKRDGQPQPTRLQKRISGISTPELVTWVETMLPTIGRNVVHHTRDGIAALQEAEVSAEAVYEIVKELKKRNQNGF
jgi:hypothetical protein